MHVENQVGYVIQKLKKDTRIKPIKIKLMNTIELTWLNFSNIKYIYVVK